MKKVLVRNGRHQSPMHAVLKRNGIGSADRHGRGIWITESDLPQIFDAIWNDPSSIKEPNGSNCCCDGTNKFNTAYYSDFADLFHATA